MTLSYTDLPSWAQWIVVLVIIIGAILTIIGFARKVWPLIARIVHTLDDLDNLPQFMITTAATLAEQDVKIAEIHHEVQFNNGSSVKDAISRVEIGVKGIYGRLDSADQDRAELREDLEQTKPRPPARKRPTQPKEN